MRVSVSLCLTFAVLALGCSAQRGRFSTSGVSGEGLESRIGYLIILDGIDNSGDGGLQDLLYALILGPVCQAHGSGSELDFGTYVTTLSYSWDCDRSTIKVAIRWDRQTDIVTVGTQNFSRSKSDLFVVRIAENGTVSTQQLTGLGSGFGPQRALDQIKKQLTNDETIALVKLSKGH